MLYWYYENSKNVKLFKMKRPFQGWLIYFRYWKKLLRLPMK